MRLHHDLLEQAQHLVRREHRRPRQASLRRAISSVYYALFHLLIAEAGRVLLTARGQHVRVLITRAFDHGTMKKTCEGFAVPQRLPLSLQQQLQEIPEDLRLIAETFVQLQQARHEADYKLDRRFTRKEAISLVERGRQAFQAWTRVRKDPAAQVFLASLLLLDKLRR
jgi:uncharacterized protein (UPF0332 family)